METLRCARAACPPRVPSGDRRLQPNPCLHSHCRQLPVAGRHPLRAGEHCASHPGCERRRGTGALRLRQDGVFRSRAPVPGFSHPKGQTLSPGWQGRGCGQRVGSGGGCSGQQPRPRGLFQTLLASSTFQGAFLSFLKCKQLEEPGDAEQPDARAAEPLSSLTASRTKASKTSSCFPLSVSKILSLLSEKHRAPASTTLPPTPVAGPRSRARESRCPHRGPCAEPGHLPANPVARLAFQRAPERLTEPCWKPLSCRDLRLLPDLLKQQSVTPARLTVPAQADRSSCC